MKTFAIVLEDKIWNAIVAERKEDVEMVMTGLNQPYQAIVEMNETTGYGGVGDEYYQNKFRQPKPSEAYEWDDASFTWKPIEPAPTDGTYVWNYVTETWQKL